MKVSVLTLGCKANQSESFIIEADLRARGCRIVGLEEKPDLCIINTCSVTSKSDYQSRQLIRRASKAGSRVIVTGCYSELNKGMIQAMEGVEDVVDVDKKLYIPLMLPIAESCTTLNYDSPSRSRFFLKVQDGCNYACSYCIIPKARGRSRSSGVEDIIGQITAVSHTYREVVLTGIHLGTYGYDLIPNVKLADLLSTSLLKTKIKRVRLSSLEIREIDERLLDLIQDERVCSHLHIPLQSGDDRILGLMNRNYTTREFFNGVERILARVPGIAIGTDIIAGFPGESAQDFKNTLKFLESLPLSYIHVFPYSARPGTEAAQMPNFVDSSTRKKRCALLRALGTRKKTEYMKTQIGRTLDLLVEDIDSATTVVGTTGNYLKVRASVTDACPKDIVSVRIAGINDDMLIGHPIQDV
ncbi:MAG: tRNA (N(6)-L-threonylcarbamoyladenosine(37)-C(2))-methylthiotransferase MtaB [Nitrospirae bacterium]|nr:tRNA (N(6)-L-threonylcarbamoyladenosine(37)-C(2))-methylthiotransferase MtaB [Nitrospirota bacterium]